MRMRIAASVGFLLMVGLLFTLVGEGRGQNDENLLPNPALLKDENQDHLPDGWRPSRAPRVQGIRPSACSWLRPTDPSEGAGALVITGGEDGAGYWETWTRDVRPHTSYRLSLMVYRSEFQQGVYPEVEIFGRRIRLDQHCMVRQYQPIFVDVNSGNRRGPSRLRLRVDHPGATFLFAWPRLVPRPEDPPPSPPLNPPSSLEEFPIGLYGAEIEALDRIKEAGFNAVQSYRKDPKFAVAFLRACRSKGLGCLLRPPWHPRDVEGFVKLLKREGQPRPGESLWFYINDEPELRSVPPSQLAEVRRRLLEVFPGRRCATAMVRPQMIPYYDEAVEIFMMDQYPVPNMPLTWLSDSVDEAVRMVGSDRVWAVVQAFGGGRYTPKGWTRRPTLEEMRALAFLSVVHGARGIFFFHYKDVAQDRRAWRDLREVVQGLVRVKEWLRIPNEPDSRGWRVEMISPFRCDARGRPAIHVAIKKRRSTAVPRFGLGADRGDEVLLIAVNVIQRPVEARIYGWPRRIDFVRDLLSQKTYAVVEDCLRLSLPPYGVALLHAEGAS